MLILAACPRGPPRTLRADRVTRARQTPDRADNAHFKTEFGLRPESRTTPTPTPPTMIRFSKMADYGVLLLGHFARNGDDLTSASGLADTYHMSRAVVANLLKEFCKAGLLESRRGLHGGYRLARSPDEITLLEILSAVDGPVQLIDCAVDELGSIGPACEYEDVCTSRSPMVSVHRRIVAFLQGLTLAQLMDSSTPVPSIPLDVTP